MPMTDTSEKGLEALIVASLVNEAGYQQGESVTTTGTTPWTWPNCRAFWRPPSPGAAEALELDQEGPQRTQFLHRLQGEIAKRGVIDVLRNGIKHGPQPRPVLRHAVPRQCQGRRALRGQPLQRHPAAALQPRRDPAALDLGLFINGLPIATFELKNSLTKQTVDDAVAAVQARPRPARAALRVRPLHGPLRRGRPGGAVLHAPEGQGLVVPAVQPGLERRRRQPAQPRRPQDRLPLEARSSRRDGLTDILENYAQVVETKDEKTGKKKRDQIFPALPPARRGAQAPGRRQAAAARASAT